MLGDVYAFGEGEGLSNPVCETLLVHLLEMLQSAPGVDRIESQLLMFPTGALGEPFAGRGFLPHPRLFMVADLHRSQPRPARRQHAAQRHRTRTLAACTL